MKKTFKQAILLFAATATLISSGACQKETAKEETASFYLTYTISTDGGQDMPGTKASSADVFDEFYQKIKSGELVAPTYEMTFTEKNTGAVYSVSGTWAGKDMVTLRTGTYKVEGKSTATGENVQDKCSLTFKDEIVVDVTSKTITLKAAYDCSLIIFSDASIATLSNFNGVTTTDLFKFSSYIYAFVNDKLYADGHKGDAYLAGTHTNGTQFKIYTGNLNYEIGKFYVYNDINTSFNIEKMEEGGYEGTPIDLSAKGNANCYIVSAPGAYKFKATVKGNSTESVGTPAKAEVLWESFGTDVKPKVGDIIATATYSDGYITFTTPTSLANGNAVVAVKDASGTILWSWHLWVCKGWDPVDTEQEYRNNAGTMMDRNLGATSATPGDITSFGLLYQWGRKDPFLSAGKRLSYKDQQETAESSIDWPEHVIGNSSYGTINFATQHPTTYIIYGPNTNDWLYSTSLPTDATRWNDSKGLYDPCPIGWKVPRGGDGNVWEKAFGETKDKYDTPYNSELMGWNLKNLINSSFDCWYPAAGTRQEWKSYLHSACYNSFYWTSYATEDKASSLAFDDSVNYVYFKSHDKADGRSVRCQKQ